MEKKAKQVDAHKSAHFILDFGNTNSKVACLRPPDVEEFVFPSAVLALNEADYQAAVSRFASQSFDLPDDTFLFSLAHRPAGVGGYLVGRQAAASPGANVTNIEKYTPDYAGVLFAATLLKFLPEGHKSVYASLAYPPGAENFVKPRVLTCLTEGFSSTAPDPNRAAVLRVIKMDGSLVSYGIAGVSAWSEPSGTIYGMMHKLSGLDLLKKGDLLLVVDVGGAITSLNAVEVVSPRRYAPVSGMAFHLPFGVKLIAQKLDAILRSSYPELFRTVAVSDKIINQIMIDPTHVNVFGFTYDFSAELYTASLDLINRLKNFFDVNFSGAADVDYVVITGGGGAVLSNLLSDKIFSRFQHVWLAEERDQLHLANLRGAVLAYLHSLEAAKRHEG